MLNLKFSHISAGFIAVLVGYTSSVSIIFQAAESLGANQAQLNSWMLVLGIGMGVTSFGLSLYYRIPIITAWSTPGAALLVTSLVGVSMTDAIASFIFCGILITVCGVTGIFAKIQHYIPASLASAMLAGILFQFGLSIFQVLSTQAFLVMVMALSYLVIKPWFKNFTIPAVLLIGTLLCLQQGLLTTTNIQFEFATPYWVSPSFNPSTMISIAIPLFIVTMTSQNVPGAATIQASGYKPPVSGVLVVTGITTMILAPFGGFSYNLAAITAAICCSEEVDSNKKTRYIAGLTTGIFYIIIGLFGATVVSLFLIAPKALVVTIAGLALLNTLGNSLHRALEDPIDREAALVTLLITVSGISFYSIGAPFWGLIGGTLTLALQRRFSKKQTSTAKQTHK